MLKKIFVSHFFVFFGIFAICFQFFSCSDSEPEIGGIFYSLIYDYTDNPQSYDLRLSVFVQPSSDQRRFDKIEVTCEKTSYTWKIENPEKVEFDKKVFLGHRNLKCPGNEVFSDGLYTVTFTDLAGRSASKSFDIEKLKSMTNASGKKVGSNSVKNTLAGQECDFKKIAIFDEIGIEVFCGFCTEEFSDKAKIIQMFPDAETKQIFYTTFDNSYVILMPKEKI